MAMTNECRSQWIDRRFGNPKCIEEKLSSQQQPDNCGDESTGRPESEEDEWLRNICRLLSNLGSGINAKLYQRG
ncbi:hypothetical protein AKJ16_DCAP04454 [Drosera capensis]